MTTLHGTDITLVGSDPSYSEIVAYSIERSDGVTAVSREPARGDAARALRAPRHRGDPELPRLRGLPPPRRPGLRQRFAPDPATKLVIHVSNFRPVKRIDAVMEVFARISAASRRGCCWSATGPSSARPTGSARELNIAPLVEMLGAQEDMIPLLSASDVFLLPSRRRASASRRSRRWRAKCRSSPRTSAACPRSSSTASPASCTSRRISTAWPRAPLRCSPTRRCTARVAEAARSRVREEFCVDRVVPMYERYYERMLG